jgi:hypothetical protein
MGKVAERLLQQKPTAISQKGAETAVELP